MGEEESAIAPFAELHAHAKRNAESRRQAEKIRALVSLIDELSGEMGSSDFRLAVRQHGYDFDQTAFDSLPQGVRDIIVKSPEWKELNGQHRPRHRLL
ncbi:MULTISPECIES: hypothetical protein [unclassified Rhizobium]|uniref:hypothetical protein n=1 Tax=unclassified Rhizobium TaxID=2613769 RepID=UPI001617AD60|nr:MULTISPECIES: hypothetical protein [unclassified Rhizobium]MBB3290506.1 hypothetical protein [Rhizobium sp. BK252]MBB3405176.1 hypothetical protein [Rhizobium sp. BK289]MBB3417833.1 hypothetical protein [Rhizobium sp. BK284]MBB3485712.1 hypothetical protein [Rhizobium sp. BK347]